MRLKGKVAIVTGGGNGIGAAYAEGLAKEGASVVIADINEANGMEMEKKINDRGYPAMFIPTDVSSEEATLNMAETAVKQFGSIDVLVNNAGIFPLCDFTELTFKQWRQVLAVNLDGVFLCSKAVTPQMIQQKSGKIINISTECIFMGFGQLVDYTASKAGVAGFTRALAEALGEHNINVNTVTPGLTASEQLLQDQPENFEPHVAAQCIKRVQKPEDLVGTIIFLASPDSDMITGQIINVDGGFNKH